MEWVKFYFVTSISPLSFGHAFIVLCLATVDFRIDCHSFLLPRTTLQLSSTSSSVTTSADPSEVMPSLSTASSETLQQISSRATKPAKHSDCPAPTKRRAHDINDEQHDNEEEVFHRLSGLTRQEQNRLSARRSRLARKAKEQEDIARLEALNKRNQYLKALVSQASAEVSAIKHLISDILAASKSAPMATPVSASTSMTSHDTPCVLSESSSL
jgi:hypothetical protein